MSILNINPNGTIPAYYTVNTGFVASNSSISGTAPLYNSNVANGTVLVTHASETSIGTRWRLFLADRIIESTDTTSVLFTKIDDWD